MQNKQKAASLLEYSLIAALIAVVCISAITALGRNAGYTHALVFAGMRCKATGYVGSFRWAKDHVALCSSGYYSGGGTDPSGVIEFFRTTCPP